MEDTDREKKICQNLFQDKYTFPLQIIPLTKLKKTLTKKRRFARTCSRTNTPFHCRSYLWQIKEDTDRETKICQHLLQDTYTFPLQIIPLAKLKKTLTQKQRFARTCCRTNTPFHCRSYLWQN